MTGESHSPAEIFGLEEKAEREVREKLAHTICFFFILLKNKSTEKWKAPHIGGYRLNYETGINEIPTTIKLYYQKYGYKNLSVCS